MAGRFDFLSDRDAIVDGAALATALAALPPSSDLRRVAVPPLRAALDAGRAEVGRRLAADPARGLLAAAAQAYLVDVLVGAIADFTVRRLYRLGHPTAAERLTIAAVGGYGRGEMAPFSDVDIAFLTPMRQPPWAEQVIESILYTLWDLGLKVGHSVRSLDDMVRHARIDMTARTALVEARPVWGDAGLYAEADARFRAEVQAGSEHAFIAAKLAEREARHRRMGDSRYVVEPNVKEGKGGLRDLHALFWIGKYVHGVGRAAELIEAGLFTPAEYRLFNRADDWLWAVRCHLHLVAGRAEERLTFDVQREVAARMRFADRPGGSAVERFMRYYFLQARSVGMLTGVFLAHLDERFAEHGARLGLPASPAVEPASLDGFRIDRGRLALPRDDWFAEDPVRLIRLFALADAHGLEIHPLAIRAATRDAKLIDENRADPHANALFLGLLTGRRDPETVLRWMNEAGVLGRFLPDFGRIAAMTQFDMYHHYTVDEHTIRAVGLLARLERGEEREAHPLASALVEGIVSRRTLYVAVLLHDVAKGRGGDHSVLGAEVACRIGPRLGLSLAEVETVAWLVRHHLLMSATAFKRDLSDPKTIRDFAAAVQSPERLRLLCILTIVDIRAVGPTTWNDWKRQLIADLYEATEEVLRPGHKRRGRTERIAAKQAALRDALGWSAAAVAAYQRRLPSSYWLAEPDDVIAHNARLLAGANGAAPAIDAQVYPDRGATLVTVVAADQPGLFYRLAGAIHVAGGTVIDARIHTTRDGTAIDNFLVQDPLGRPFAEAERIGRLKDEIADALAGRGRPDRRLGARPPPRPRSDAFAVAPAVVIDNRASHRFTVVEVTVRDRPALLKRLAQALFEAEVTIHSAHVATYGERAVDSFYVTDLAGGKVADEGRMGVLEERLLAAARGADALAA